MINALHLIWIIPLSAAFGLVAAALCVAAKKIKKENKNMEFPNIATVVSIIVLCLLAGQIVKATSLNAKWIPILCGLVGAVLGVVGLGVIPEFPATNWLDAAAVGAASGFASTGVHQLYKQTREG